MKRLLYLWLVACVAMGVFKSEAQIKRTCNIVFIGNSITACALHDDKENTAPPVIAADYVERMLGADVTFRNCGRSGATTVDFLPERARDFKRVEKAVADIKEQSLEPIVFSIMLGTNDSASKGPLGAPVSNEDYKANLLKMITRQRELSPNAIFVLQRTIWYSPNPFPPIKLVRGIRYKAPMSLAKKPPPAIHIAPFMNPSLFFERIPAPDVWGSLIYFSSFNAISCGVKQSSTGKPRP